MSKRIIIAVVALLLFVAGIVWLVKRDNRETPAPVLSVSAFNQTKNKTATDIAANPGDVIVYTLKAENQGNEVIEGYIMEASIADITDKVALVDASGASYNAATNSLVWTPLDIPAHEAISKAFTVKVNPLPTGTTSQTLTVKFNNEISITMAAPTVASTNTNKNLYVAPPTGASEFIPALLALIVTLAYLAIRKYRHIRV